MILNFNYSFATSSSYDSTDKHSTNHFQLTVIDQVHNGFKARYTGKNSLKPIAESALSITSTFFTGRTLWKNGSIYFNPELSGGKGLSSTLGIAGFPNGETFRIGNPIPVVYIARLYIQHRFNFDHSNKEQLKDELNQIHETVSKHRLLITCGKILLPDYFDNNKVSHDPRNDFFNWALMNNGAWDYPANTRGYTEGLVFEYYRYHWTLRGAAALISSTVNGPEMDRNFWKGHGFVMELHHKYSLFKSKLPGNIRLLLFYNKTKAADYLKTVNNFRTTGDSSLLNVYNSNVYDGTKYGFGINIDQQVGKYSFVFSRIGWNDGRTGTWEFTEIDQTLTAGFRIYGTKWKRSLDNIGIAGIINGISKGHQTYLASGGYGFMIGDGRLRYGLEHILELFYQAQMNSFLNLTFNYQFVKNPAYNKDRGPVHLFALRAHVQF
jgi:high affinity Mn2+ porin